MAFEVINLNRQPKAWDSFYRLPALIYGKDDSYCLQSVSSVRESVDRPDFTGNQLPLVVMEGDTPVARMVTRISDNLVSTHSGPTGMFGFFEAQNMEVAVRMMFDRGIAWLKQQGSSTVIGPMDGDTWHKYRLNTGPFDTDPFMMEPYNCPYYQGLWEKYGFRVLARYYSKNITDVNKVTVKFEQFYKRSLKNGFTFRGIQTHSLNEELHILYNMSCEIFSENAYYSEIPEQAFVKMYSNAKAIINPNLVWFCLDKDNKYAGFVFSFPDYFEAIKSMKGKNHLLSKFNFFLNRRKADTLNIKTLGTMPEHRGLGLGPALMYKVYDAWAKYGYKKANMCLIHEDNSSGRMDGNQGRVFRYYALYILEF